jgi:hypothetical protein
MSRVKDPREKKRLSLDRDRRNVFGENSKASRKNIPKAKQRRQMAERRAITQLLGRLKGGVEEDAASDAELATKLKMTVSKNRGFEKMPDQPLRTVLNRKKERLSQRIERNKQKKLQASRG